MKFEELLGAIKSRAFADKFTFLQEIVRYLNRQENGARNHELILRLLDCKREFVGYEPIIDSLTRKSGLFPYLDQSRLSFQDALAYEFHRPEGLVDRVFHKAQYDIYIQLLNGRSVILSAPTSFGKSLIIDALIAQYRYNNIVIVLPTIALIDETRRRLFKFKSVYKIITHASQAWSHKNIFVVTQERAVDFVLTKDVKIDFFIIDEFYKIQAPEEGNKERSNTLNKALYELLKKSEQFYMLGPNIDKINNVFHPKPLFIKTDYSTVITEIERVQYEGESLDALIKKCVELNAATIIYCKSPNSANKVAQHFIGSGLFPKLEKNSEAIRWLKSNYHEQWIFPMALEYGIGIHHGSIPRSMAQYVVHLFNSKKLNYLICTSTLIEGVNSVAKNIIIYDNQIASDKFDYFTFKNIGGRAGRMMEHFIGKVYLFHDPPESKRAEVDFPILSQPNEMPEALLLQIEEKDLTSNSIKRLEKFLNQDVLSIEVLRKNSGVDPDSQLALAKELYRDPASCRKFLSWKQFPNKEQRLYVCELIWTHFVSVGRVSGVVSGKQLAYKLALLHDAKDDMKSLIDSATEQAETVEEINKEIDSVFDFVRNWASFHFPNYLMVLHNIQKEVLKNMNIPPGDYSAYAGRVECLFTDSTIVALDEYGLPIPVSMKLWNNLKPNGKLDEVLDRFRNLDLTNLNLSRFERTIAINVQAQI